MAEMRHPAVEALLAAAERSFPSRGLLRRLTFASLLARVFLAGCAACGFILFGCALLIPAAMFGVSSFAQFGILYAVILAIVLPPLYVLRWFATLSEAASAEEKEWVRLSPKDEPLLFAVVERFCRSFRTPTPQYIAVQAGPQTAVVFHQSAGKPCSLLIGLPLVGRFNLQEFAGVLVHECAHLAQTKSVRVAEACEVFADGLQWGAVATVPRLFSCLIRREMESDADWFEAAFAGSRTAIAATGKSQTISLAWELLEEVVHAESAVRDLIAKCLADAERLQLIPRRYAIPPRAGWLDESPADTDRLAAIERQDAPGMFHSDAPAAVLFQDFPGLCERATRAYYRHTRIEIAAF